MTSLSAHPLLPHVMDVMDRMDAAQLTESDPRIFEKALTEAVTQTCQRQGQEVDPEALARAVEDHVAQGPLGATTLGPSELDDCFGWKRPVSMDALNAERQNLSRPGYDFMAWLSLDSNGQNNSFGGALVVAASFAAGALTCMGLDFVIAQTSLSSVGLGILPWIGGLTALALTAGWLMNASGRIIARRQALAPVIPPDAVIDAWLTWPVTRYYLQRCLTSAAPMILEGDSAQLGHLQVTAELALADVRMKQRAKDVDEEAAKRMANVRSKVLNTLKGPVANKDTHEA